VSVGDFSPTITGNYNSTVVRHAKAEPLVQFKGSGLCNRGVLMAYFADHHWLIG
jgi:hypothetical protein